MVNKQKELEVTVLVESYALISITEIWWDKSNDWSVTIDGYKLVRKAKNIPRGSRVALYIEK